MSLAIYLLLFCLIAAGIWLAIIWPGFSQQWMPDELKGLQLVNIEKNIFVSSPYPLAGRPDQVFFSPEFGHVPLEYKNRDNFSVYNTDIAQLSLQAWLLRISGRNTAGFGYVVINSRKMKERKTLRVDLYDDRKCEQIIERGIGIIEDRKIPRKSIGNKCNTCGHVTRCRES